MSSEQFLLGAGGVVRVEASEDLDSVGGRMGASRRLETDSRFCSFAVRGIEMETEMRSGWRLNVEG